MLYRRKSQLSAGMRGEGWICGTLRPSSCPGSSPPAWCRRDSGSSVPTRRVRQLGQAAVSPGRTGGTRAALCRRSRVRALGGTRRGPECPVLQPNALNRARCGARPGLRLRGRPSAAPARRPPRTSGCTRGRRRQRARSAEAARAARKHPLPRRRPDPKRPDRGRARRSPEAPPRAAGTSGRSRKLGGLARGPACGRPACLGRSEGQGCTGRRRRGKWSGRPTPEGNERGPWRGGA